MVLLHSIRCLRHAHRGRKIQRSAMERIKASLTATASNTSGVGGDIDTLAAQAFARSFMPNQVVSTAYCGLHMIDMAGHVNNAKYLEIYEYGRWHQLSFLGLTDFFRGQSGIFVVADLTIQYVREIKPFVTVQVTTQFLPATDTPTEANHGRNKRLVCSQAIWSADGSKLHSAAVMEVALLAPPSYAAHLNETFNNPFPTPSSSSSSSSSPAGDAGEKKRKAGSAPPGRVTLDTHQVLADCTRLSLSEVDALLFESRHNFLSSMAPVGREGGGGIGGGGGQATDLPPPQWLTQLTVAKSDWRKNIRDMVGPSPGPK